MRSALRLIAATAIALTSLAVGAARAFDEQPPARTAHPDVVILLTDQQRADAFAAAGAPDLATPAMDGLARAGAMFTHAFVATPQCSPSRAALLTGRYPHRTGVMGNTTDGAAGRTKPASAGMSRPLDGGIPTMARVFASAGYETAYFGKWHLGGTPGEYGFDVHDARVDDRTLARRAVDFLAQRSVGGERRPLLLVVSWLDPHDIYGVLANPPPDRAALERVRMPANLIDPLDNKPAPQRQYLREDQGRPFVGADAAVWRRYRAFYNRLVEGVDREIGTLLRALDARPSSRITVFSSDHGDLGGAHGLPYKGPAMYDELVRVPLVISWPGRIGAARSDALVSLVDLLPTLCDLAELTPPEGMDGVSLRPVLEGKAPAVRDLLFAEYFGKQAWRVPIRMVRTTRWKYVRYAGHGEELYDLAGDPGELRNLARDPSAASERSRLEHALSEWMRTTGDPFPQLAPTDRAGNVLTGSIGR